jgi:hypothetical protein
MITNDHLNDNYVTRNFIDYLQSLNPSTRAQLIHSVCEMTNVPPAMIQQGMNQLIQPASCNCNSIYDIPQQQPNYNFPFKTYLVIYCFIFSIYL